MTPLKSVTVSRYSLQTIPSEAKNSVAVAIRCHSKGYHIGVDVMYELTRPSGHRQKWTQAEGDGDKTAEGEHCRVQAELRDHG